MRSWQISTAAADGAIEMGEQTADRGVEVRTQQRADVPEQDAGLREIGNLYDQVSERLHDHLAHRA